MKNTLLSLIAAWPLLSLPAPAATYYVNSSNPAPQTPYGDWGTAATNIQDALNLAGDHDTVLVTNGVYAFGGAVVAGDLLNRVALTNAVTVQSVNGPWVTTIQGAGATNGTAAVRCAWLTNGAALVGFTVTGGATRTSGTAATLESGGGIWCASSNATVANCVLVANTAYNSGGAVYQGTVRNCLITTNALSANSGAASGNVLNNCTVVGNSSYGVASPLAMTNCIIYFNGPGNVTSAGNAVSHCCSVPALTGSGNLTNAPQLFVDGIHLATNSPCIGAGVPTAAGTDLFGQIWSNPPSLGCAEWSPAPVITGPPAVQLLPTYGVTVSVNVDAVPPCSYRWTKDGMPLGNGGHYSWVDTPMVLVNNWNIGDAGGYQVVVSNAFGVATSIVSQVVVHCVDASGTNPLPPYTAWAGAATNIQDAVDAANAGDVILVTNGVYAYGGRAMTSNSTTNRVAINKALVLESVNGPWVTTIRGGNVPSGTSAAMRCVWLADGAALNGFRLQGGGTWLSADRGGGVCCAVSNATVANCLIVSNTAASLGGGIYQGNLWNCAIFGNNCQLGGGAAYSFLRNCTVVGNLGFPGSVYYCGLTNCIVYYNSNNTYTSSFSYCCSDQWSGGVGDFTNPPQLFPDNVHLLTNSPCIGTGLSISAGTDFDGHSWANPPSIGCSEAPTVPLASQPRFQTVGDPAGFSASAIITGSGPLSCWWLCNGIPLSDDGNFRSTQTSQLKVTGVNYTNAGTYQLVVSNSYGMVTSAVAQLVIHCVDVNGTSPAAPYSTWATAATNIQDAITVAAAGEVVLVTNGVYATGGISMDGVITNRVSVNKALLLQSANGSGSTTIQGAWDPVATNGPGAVRCVWLTNYAVISGFTLAGGATRASAVGGSAMDGGGILGSASNNVPLAVAANCLIVSNAASDAGGGASQTVLNYCIIATNIVTGTGSVIQGGGANHSYLKNCQVTGNEAMGAQNSSLGSGGGLSLCYSTNCLITRNSAKYYGGGAFQGVLVNCTLTGNQAISSSSEGGGAANSTLVNSIVLFNATFLASSYASYSNSYSCSFSYSCTIPAAGGTGNIAADPLLLPDGIHLSAGSPCIGKGNPSAAFGWDIDGQAWNNPPSMGCDEWQPAPVIMFPPSYSVAGPGHGLTWNPAVAGQAPFAWFWSKDGNPIQDNGHYLNAGTPGLTIATLSPDDAGGYQLIATNASGSATSAVVRVVIHAVDAAGSNPTAPYSTWSTAANTIQDAIDAAAPGEIVLVTNGVYGSGGQALPGGLTNRITVSQAITVTSVNGPAGTVIEGAGAANPLSNLPGAVRCAFLADGALLNGFTLRDGSTLASGVSLASGGGICCVSTNGVASDCVLSNNSAFYGGGIANGTLNNCLVYGNHANVGGGCYDAALYNCTVINNYLNLAFVSEGAGFYSSSYNNPVRNSIVIGNYDMSYWMSADEYHAIGAPNFSYCCTTPVPSGTGNFDADPLFLDSYHITANSPCRGAGGAAYASGTDLDGETWTNPPSVGCDEVIPADLAGPLTVSVIPINIILLPNRLISLSGMITGRAAYMNWDFGDGTIITNTGGAVTHQWASPGNYSVTCTVFNNDNPGGVSATIIVPVQPLNPPQLQLTAVTGGTFQFQFAGQTNANYTVQYATNLTPPVVWQTLSTIYYNLSASIPISDPVSTNNARFYRVLAQ